MHHSGGESFDAEVVSVERDPSGVLAVTFHVDQETWTQLNKAEAFHTERSRRVGDIEGNFEPGSPIAIEAILDDLVIESLDLFGVDEAELEARLTATKLEGLDEFLLSASSWWAGTVTQEVELPPELADKGSIREGFRMESPD